MSQISTGIASDDLSFHKNGLSYSCIVLWSVVCGSVACNEEDILAFILRMLKYLQGNK
jgi:hypothetical protein